jgi:uncharacterized protein
MQCTSPECKERATHHLTWVENRHCVNEHLCEPHARSAITLYVGPSTEFSGIRKSVENARQFEIGLIVISEISDQQVVYLYAVDGSRLAPMTMGIFEATSLARKLNGYPTPRPLTHDAFADCIQLLGGELQDIVIHRLDHHIYYANARIVQQNELVLLDLRPSDAYILAVHCGCPIFIADQVLDQIDQQGNVK